MIEGPQNLVLERSVLAGIAKHGFDAFCDVDDVLTVSSFTFETNQMLWKCYQHIFQHDPESIIDIPTILSSANSLGLQQWLSSTNEQKHIRAIFNFGETVAIENMRKNATKLAKLEVARMIREQLPEIDGDLTEVKGDESLSLIIGMFENRAFEFASKLLSSDSETPIHISDGGLEFLKFLHENKRTTIGVSTGFPLYDNCIGGGLRRKSTNIIGARMKKGKTTLGTSIARHISKTLNIPVLFLDTEMDKDDLYTKLIANIGNIEISDIEKGQFDFSVAEKAHNDIVDSKFHYKNISGKAFEDILSTMRRWVVKEVGINSDTGRTNDCVIIYDYLKLMTGEGINNHMQEYQLLGFQMMMMQNFAIKHDLPILSFVQLNRDGIEKEGTDVIAGSDRIGWFAGSVAIFKDKTPEEMAEDGYEYNRKLIPLVARYGEEIQYGDYINLKLDGKYGRMTEGCLKSQLATKKVKNDGFTVESTKETDVPYPFQEN